VERGLEGNERLIMRGILGMQNVSWEVNGSRSCPVVSFGIVGVEPLSSLTMDFV
jgi:hypothetical protein